MLYAAYWRRSLPVNSLSGLLRLLLTSVHTSLLVWSLTTRQCQALRRSQHTLQLLLRDHLAAALESAINVCCVSRMLSSSLSDLLSTSPSPPLSQLYFKWPIILCFWWLRLCLTEISLGDRFRISGVMYCTVGMPFVIHDALSFLSQHQSFLSPIICVLSSFKKICCNDCCLLKH